MTTTAKLLPASGPRVGVVCGPGNTPKDDAGTVLCQASNSWGSFAVALMDSGKIEHCRGLTEIGIGWYSL